MRTRGTMMIAIAAGLLALSGNNWAKLPAPTEEQKIKADEAKAKAVHTDKVAAYQLCKSQNAVAETYARQQKAKGVDVKIDPTACQDPGPFVAPAPAAAAAPAATLAPAAQAAAAPTPAPAAAQQK